MSRVVAIGNPLELLGWALAGADLIEAVDPERVLEAWGGLEDDVGLVVLTASARRALPPRLEQGPLWAVVGT